MNNREHVIILLVGRTCSGKSTLAKTLCERTGLIALQSYTTRPQRSEADNDHMFVSVDEYFKAKESGEIAIDGSIAGNYYYATIDQIYSSDVYTINPEALDRLLTMNLPDIRFVVVYVSCPDKIREERAIIRGDDKYKYRVRDFSEKQQFRKFVVEEQWDYSIKNINPSKSYSVLKWISQIENVWQNHVEDKEQS